MSRNLRIFAIVVGVVVVLLLVSPFLIPVNQFRPTIEEKASAALGRKVTLGNLSLSILSGSLSAENLSIGDDPKFSPSAFLTAKSLKVGVQLMPLIFSRSLKVTGVTIENPQVTLLRDPSGKWNFSSLGGASSPAPAKPNPAAAKSESPSPASPSALSVKKLELKNGRIIVGATNSQRRSTYDNVNVAASDFSMTAKFPLSVTADLPGGGKLKLDGNVGPIDQADASLTPLDAKLSVDSLNLASTGFLDPSIGLGGILDLDAALVSQSGEAETKGSAKLSKALLVAGGSPAGVPATVDFSTKYDLRKNSGVLHPSTLKIGNAAARLSGTYLSPDDTTVVNMKLDGQNMPASDLQAFLPALGINLPKGASLASGTLSANLNIQGPTNKLITTGNVGLYSAKLAGFDLGSKLSAISALTGAKTGSDLIIEKLTTNVRMAPDGLRADNFNAIVPALGTLIGAGTIDAKNNLDFKMVATLTNPISGAAGAAAGPAAGAMGALGGMLGKITGGGGAAAAKGQRIPFLVQGTASDPKFIPDLSGVALEMLKSKLGGLAAPAATQPDSTSPLSGIESLFKKKKP
jgi:AsmA protein